MSETPKGFTPKKIRLAVLLFFFACLFGGVSFYHQGTPLTIVLISWGSALVIGLGVLAVMIRLSRPNTVALSGAVRAEGGKSSVMRKFRWLFFACAIVFIIRIPLQLVHALRLAKGSPARIGAFIDMAVYIALMWCFLYLWWKLQRAPDSK